MIIIKKSKRNIFSVGALVICHLLFFAWQQLHQAEVNHLYELQAYGLFNRTLDRGRVYDLQKKYPEAEACFKLALEQARELRIEQADCCIAETQALYTQCLIDQSKISEAEPFYVELIKSNLASDLRLFVLADHYENQANFHTFAQMPDLANLCQEHRIKLTALRSTSAPAE